MSKEADVDWSTPLAPLVHGLEGQVLERLYRVQAPQTAGDIRKRTGYRVSMTGVRKALDRLVEQGLVTGTTIGNAVGYELNTDHLVYPAVAAALDAYRPYQLLRERLHELVINELGSAHPPSVAIYGSVARREATTSSDVDIVIVTPKDWARDHQAAFDLVPLMYDRVTRWTGNAAQIVATTHDDLLNAREAGDPFTESLAEEADTVIGPDVRALLATMGRRA